MKKTILLCATLSMLVSCKTEKKEDSRKPISQKTTQMTNENPLLVKSTLDYGAPDFTKIKDEHYLPAILEGMNIQNAEIKKITNNTDTPTFENTVLAFEESDKTLQSVLNVFYGVAGFNTNDVIKKVQEELAPKLSEHNDNILLNTKLFERIKTVYNSDEKLDEESKQLVKVIYERFAKAGANLSEDKKAELKKLNSELATLSNAFNKNVLEAMKKGGLVVSDKSKLKGLSQEKLKSLEKDAKYTIQLLNFTQQPSLQSLEERETRKALLEKSLNRTDGGEFNTNDLVLKIAQLRAKKAKVLGFDNYASWSLQGTMAKTPQRVFEMFKNLISGGLEKANSEIKEIQAEINKDSKDFKLQAYDWNYYAEKLRKSKYDLDENEIKPYFELNKVVEDGIFYTATKLYGITFKERKDIPVYHPDVKVYEIFEEDGSKLGLFYCDYFARDSKRGGAWMSSFVKQSKLRGQKPVIYNICNFDKPAKGEPALISYDNAETVFHEFGHALHGFFGNQKYATLSGTSVARDFVEFPSQFNENWMTHPEVLNNFAKHYKTGEVIPKALLDKIKSAGTFNQGYSIIENLASSNLDMQWHTQSEEVLNKVTDVNAFETEALAKMKLNVSEIPPRYRSSYFAHIFGGGYSAGYYSYLWTEMLSHDAYDWFKHNGLLTRENGQKFRDNILSKGNTMDYAQMYKAFTGRDPKAQPMLKARGL